MLRIIRFEKNMKITKQESTCCPQQDLKTVKMAIQGSTSDAEMLAEAAMLREHRNRLENRMVNDHFVFIIVNIIIIIVSSVRSSNSHPDLLVIHPTFSDLAYLPIYNNWTFTF